MEFYNNICAACASAELNSDGTCAVCGGGEFYAGPVVGEKDSLTLEGLDGLEIRQCRDFCDLVRSDGEAAITIFCLSGDFSNPEALRVARAIKALPGLIEWYKTAIAEINLCRMMLGESEENRNKALAEYREVLAQLEPQNDEQTK
jgi:hypothetical protein